MRKKKSVPRQSKCAAFYEALVEKRRFNMISLSHMKQLLNATFTYIIVESRRQERYKRKLCKAHVNVKCEVNADCNGTIYCKG